jgi:DNA-binding transcriptional ArsR family regulator
MPDPTRPANIESAEDPIDVFGGRYRAGIIGYLREHPDAGAGEIGTAIGASRMTAYRAIEELVDAGLVLADPPRDQAVRGQWIQYRVDDAAVTEMYLRLGIAIGEI